ncbi:MAG: leucine-rich repeat protein [Eubacterium sp.]|nr:leucine-rich repeat protein [Eubacterium sp.]
MKKKGKTSVMMRVVSIMLVLALVVTSVQTVLSPRRVTKAASAESMGDMEMLSASHVPDSEVRSFYTILANAQKNLEVAQKKEDEAAIVAAEAVIQELSGMNAGAVKTKYGNNSTYTEQVYGRYLVNYPGKIDFTGLTVKNIQGIGWARSVSEFDLSGVSVTEVPENEFAFCKMEKIVLPDGVTKIGNNAFGACSNLVTLIIGTGEENIVDLTKINEVGASAFSGCAAITAVKFADYDASRTELKLGTRAFASCKSLEEIKIPIKTAANLGANAFEQCVKLVKVGLHNDLAYLSNGLFQGAGASEFQIRFYVIEKGEKESASQLPDNITYVGDNCFANAWLWAMDLSTCDKLTKLNQYSFSTSKIFSLKLPESLETIEMQAFGAATVDTIVIPEKCTNIGTEAFSRSTIREITLPDALTEIKAGTFQTCEFLDGNAIHLSENSKLEKIGSYAFASCGDLQTTAFIKNLKKLTTIEAYAFANCSAYWKDKNGNTINDAYRETTVASGLEEIILPDSVVSLGESVFEENYALRKVDLGNGVKEIPDKAFYLKSQGAKLETVILPDELESIGKSAFENQTRLFTIGTQTAKKEGTLQFGSKLASIGDRAFAGCSVENSINVSGVKAYALKENVRTASEPGLSQLKIFDYNNAYDKENTDNAARAADYCRIIYIDEADILSKGSLPEGTFNEEGELKDTNYMELYIVAKRAWVDDDLLMSTKTDSTDKQIEIYKNEYETDTQAYKDRFYSKYDGTLTGTFYCSQSNAGSVISLQSAAGKRECWIRAVVNSEIEHAALPGESCSIGMTYVFGVRDVSLPDSMREDSLGASAFEKCFSLNKVILSENLTEIKQNTFSGAAKEISSSNGGKYYDYYGLRTVYIPEGMKKIGDGAFQRCYNLYFKESSTSALGTSLESIGNNAFMECYSLETMKFPTSLTTIGSSAFAQCAVRNVSDVDCKREAVIKEDNKEIKYPYYWNYEKYGKRREKTGLRKLDFSAAKNLEVIGSSAFRHCNMTDVQLTNSPLVEVSDGLFDQCSYLKNVSFGDKVQSVEQNVLRDTVSLTTVSIPASASIKGTAISGAFGKVTMDRENLKKQADPTLSLSYKENEEIVIPIHDSVRLPINAFNKDVLNGSVKVVIVDGSTETDILGKSAQGLRAEFDMSKEPYSFVLHGEAYLKDPVTVKIEAGAAFTYINAKNTGWSSSHTFTYRVSVQDVPTQSISVSASEDTTVKGNPSMYDETTGKKALYIPVKSSAAANGIRLTAKIDPVETTDQVSWSSTDNEVAEISDMQYEPGSGVATAIVTCKKPGDATVTVTSGTVHDKIVVTGQIPVAAGGLSCTTGGGLLDTKITNNAVFGLSVGDSDKINIGVDYGKTDYDDSLLGIYGEKAVIESSDENVVTVSPDGTFRAVGEGTAVITIKGQASGTKMQFTLQVSKENNYTPFSVTVTGANEVNVGESIQLSAAVAPKVASQAVTWSVASGQNCVSVDAEGKVTGLARGEATIVAASSEKDSVRSEAFKVKVNAPLKELRILDGNVTLEVGRSMSFAKTTKTDATKGFFVSPSDTTDKIDWKSSNEGILQVTQGTIQNVTVKALAVGTAELTGISSSGVHASVVINVIQKADSITVDKEVTLNVGKTHKLNPQKVPANSNEELTYTYSSGDPKIATVDVSGVIRAVAPGAVSINVKSNTGRTASCRVTVKQPANKITLLLNRPSIKTVYVAKGKSVTLNTRLAPENTTDKLTYKSSKAKVASVASNGVVTAKKKGSAKITIQADSGKKISVKIVVSRKEVKAKKVKIKAPKTVKRKKTVKLTVSLKSAKSTDTLSFASNKPNIAEIDAYGYLKAKKKGKVKITVTASSGKKAVKTIKVK